MNHHVSTLQYSLRDGEKQMLSPTNTAKHGSSQG